MLHQEKVEVRKTQLVFIMMRRKPSYCSGRGRIYSTKTCLGVSVQQPVGIYLEEQTQPFQWVGRLRKMTISSEDYCSNIALSPKSNFLRPYCLNPCLNRFCLSYLFLLPPSTFVCLQTDRERTTRQQSFWQMSSISIDCLLFVISCHL